MVCVVGRMRDLILQLSKSSIYSTKPFFIPSVNVIGADSLTDAMNMMADYGFTRTLIVTDNMLTKLGMAGG